MRKVVVYTVLLVLLVLAGGGNAFAQKENIPYIHGESLTYVVNYKWGAVDTDVGEAVTNLEYADGMFHTIITGKTFRFYDRIFRVREHFESRFHEEPLQPHYFYRDTQEGKYRMRNTFHFNVPDSTIQVRMQKYERTPKDTLVKGNGNTYDIPSLFYKVRRMDFDSVAIGVKQPISFIIDDDVYNFYFILVGKEVKKIKGLGTFNTLKFAVKLVAGTVFTGKDDMFIWVTDDENKVPLLFESPIIVGRVQGRLISYKNLKSPLTSKIK